MFLRSLTEDGIKDNLQDFTAFLGQHYFNVSIFIVKIEDEGARCVWGSGGNVDYRITRAEAIDTTTLSYKIIFLKNHINSIFIQFF